MVLFNYSTKELTAKVVYYGPGLCGKTTNLQWIHEKVPIKNKGKMLSLATETDRTLFFDFLPIEIGTIRGMKTRIQLYTVPGQVFYNATRRMVLKGADCLVFVVDSQEPMLDASIESFENLRQNLEANEIDPEQIPMVLQYNKRDLPNALPIEILNERMNPNGYPFYEAVAVKGVGVEETLKGVTKLVFKSLSAKYGEPAAVPAQAGPAPAARSATNPLPGQGLRPASPPSATIPPDGPRLVAESPEELLDGLDLTPPAIGLEPEPVLGSVAGASTAQGRSTLVAEADEAEDLRRQIKGPISGPDYEVNLEELSPPAEPMDEITLDSEPLPIFEPEAEALDADPTMAPLPLDEPEDPPLPLPVRVPPPVPPPQPVRSVEPRPLVIEVEAGRTDLAVPIELHVEPGVEEVNLSLRLVFKIRR
jgi:signal recognition particle receptor subunit beta